MLLSLLFAGLTGIFVWKKRWGAAVFTGMMFFYFLWLNMLALLNAIWIGHQTGF